MVQASNAAAEKAGEVFSYDELPYESYVYKTTHPDHLYVVGRMFGMNPPDFATARVLELGCASGGNLFPYAVRYPKSKCVGVDLSVEEINEGNRIRKEMGLKNAELMQKNIMEIGKDFGAFDYIICHGVFSWVPDEVRDRILVLCRDNLSKNGMAFISYNAYPGWHFTGAVRNIMKYHAGLFKTPQEKVMQVRALLNFLSDNMPAGNAVVKQIIDAERETFTKVNDTYIYHDHLSGINSPYYLHEFADMLAKHDLQYVGDTNVNTMYLKNMGEAVSRQLSKIPDIVRQEQYMDFLNNRRFRMSIVTHKDVVLNRNVDPARIMDFYLTARYRPEAKDPDITKEISFKKGDGGGHFKTTEPPASAFFMALFEAGKIPASVEDIVRRTLEKLKEKGQEEDERMVRPLVLRLGAEFAFSGLIDLHASSVGVVRAVSKKPVAYAIARQEAKDRPDRKNLTCAYHETVSTDRFVNRLLLLCDGKRDAKAMAEKMMEVVREGEVVLLDTSGLPFASSAITHDKISEMVEKSLERFARAGLLVA
ncbi:MAG: methyltransferase regulatory domain-containing protein [Proteobacteria bacterium]|nr:methyltransferase regulatory domain-containing protein [Pseudomonadota bacterium]